MISGRKNTSVTSVVRSKRHKGFMLFPVFFNYLIKSAIGINIFSKLVYRFSALWCKPVHVIIIITVIQNYKVVIIRNYQLFRLFVALVNGWINEVVYLSALKNLGY